jgi:hypothetical protein
VLGGVDGSLHFRVPPMNRQYKTESATFSILPFLTFFRNSYFLYFIVTLFDKFKSNFFIKISIIIIIILVFSIIIVIIISVYIKLSLFFCYYFQYHLLIESAQTVRYLGLNIDETLPGEFILNGILLNVDTRR